MNDEPTQLPHKPLVYLAGPYTHPDPAANVRRAIHWGDALLNDSLCIPLIPHLTHLWHLMCPHSLGEWYRYDLYLLERCDAVFRILGQSNGADQEVEYAEKVLGIPVFHTLNALRHWCKEAIKP